MTDPTWGRRRGTPRPASLNTASQPAKPTLKAKGLTKGLEPCEACGKVVAPGRRSRPHVETPECLVIRTQTAYKLRGWVPLTPKLAAVLREAGVPVELAPGGVHLEPRLIPTPPPFEPDSPEHAAMQAATRPLNKVVHDEVVHDVPFAPAACVRLVHALRTIPHDFRLRAVRTLYKREDIGEAIDAIQRLGGRVKGFVHRLVMDAEEQEREAEAKAKGEGGP